MCTVNVNHVTLHNNSSAITPTLNKTTEKIFSKVKLYQHTITKQFSYQLFKKYLGFPIITYKSYLHSNKKDN